MVKRHTQEYFLRASKVLDPIISGSKEKKHIVFSHQGKSIGISGFSLRPENYSANPSYWAMPEYDEIKNEFDEIIENDFRIAYIHWGNEFINYPYFDQKQFAHLLVDIGFDLVIGMHPHILQGYEIYNNKYIFYSLGNFVFNMPWYKTKYSAVISVDCSSENLSVNYDYVKIGTDYRPEVVSRDVVPVECRFEQLNALIDNIPENEIYYRQVFRNMKEYRKSNYIELIRNINKFRRRDIFEILSDFIKRKLHR